MRQVNAAVLRVYLCGATTRGSAARSARCCRGGRCRRRVSRIVQGLTAQVAAWQARSLADLDLVDLYLDGFHLRVRLGGRVSSVPVLAVLGVQRSGQKVLVRLRSAGARARRVDGGV